MTNITLPYNWKPRKYQQNLWKALCKGVKRSVVCWPRRHGKDEVMLHHNACAAFERVGNYWYLLPEYNQCRKAIWDAVNPHTGKKRLDEAFPPAIRENTLVQEMKIVLPNGSTWQLMGSDNYNALVGSPPVGITFSEYALSDPSSWGFLRPILLENGGWAAFNSTPRGKNHFHKLLRMAQKSEDWFSEFLTSDDTQVYTPEQLQTELRELQDEHGETYGKAIWLQEYFCSFEAALPGSIWGEDILRMQVNKQIGDVPHEPGYPVFTAWDLGRDDDTAIWFYQVIGDEIHIIDYYADNFKEIPFYAQLLRDKKRERGFDYGIHWLPHDAKPKRLGMGGKSILQQFADESVGKFDIVPDLSIEDGIQAARATFKKTYFDLSHTDEGLEHLKSYARKYDETKQFFSNPVHDGHSHAADAFRYLSLTWKLSRAQAPPLTPQQRLQAGNIINVNFGTLKSAHFEKQRRAREE